MVLREKHVSQHPSCSCTSWIFSSGMVCLLTATWQQQSFWAEWKTTLSWFTWKVGKEGQVRAASGQRVIRLEGSGAAKLR